MFRNRAFVAVVSGHFVVDALNGIGAVLLAVLASPLALTNSQIGLALTLYALANSLTQPLFGWIADRAAGRELLLAGFGVAWMVVCYIGVSLATTWALFLPIFIAAALGSALFHPIGTATAAQAGGARAGSATSVFFFFGQIGLALSPVVAGVLFGYSIRIGIIPLALLAIIPALLLMYTRTIGEHQRAANQAHAQRPREKVLPDKRTLAILLIGAFILLVAIRSSIQAAYTAFLPKLFADRGWDSETYGLLTGTFMGAAAVGNIVMGDLADRFGMRMVTVIPLLLSVPAGIACFLVPSLPLTFVASAIAGALVGGQHSILVLHAQRLLPAQQGFAAGLILGFTFGAGAFGSWLVGLSADTYGLTNVMITATLFGIPAALLAFTLPGRRHPAPVTTEALAAVGMKS